MNAPTIYNTAVRFRRADGTEGTSITSDDYLASTIAHHREQGYAIIELDRQRYCGTCNGTGTVRRSLRHAVRRCPTCKGDACGPAPLPAGAFGEVTP